MSYSGPGVDCAGKSGFSLLELIITLAISSALTLTLVQLALVARNSFRLQEAIAELQEHGRYFGDWTAMILADSGYRPKPWLPGETVVGLMPDSMDGATPGGDRLVTRAWSAHNCFQSPNPTDSAGAAVFYLKESVLEINNGNLAYTCRLGPDQTSLVTQINRQGAIPQVDSFQVQYAIDSDKDNQADGWLNRSQWLDNQAIMAVRLAIVTHSAEPVVMPADKQFDVLDYEFTAPADGRLRRKFSLSIPTVH